MKKKEKKWLLWAAVFAWASASCGFLTRKEAIDYNNKLIDMQSRIEKSMTGLADSLMDPAAREKRYAELLAVSAAVVKEAEALPPFRNDSSLRDAALNLFRFYESISKKEYKEMLDIFQKGDFSDKASARIDEMNKDISQREDILLAEFQKAQKAFAEKYGIQLVASESQK